MSGSGSDDVTLHDADERGLHREVGGVTFLARDVAVVGQAEESLGDDAGAEPPDDPGVVLAEAVDVGAGVRPLPEVLPGELHGPVGVHRLQVVLHAHRCDLLLDVAERLADERGAGVH